MLDKVVIGRNSEIARALSLTNTLYISHRDSFEVCKGKLVIVFSVDKKSENGNRKMFKKLESVEPEGIVLVSSVSVLVGDARFYTYVRMKVLQEVLLSKLKIKYSILRLSTPDWIESARRKPNLVFTKQNLESYLNELTLDDLKNNIDYLVDTVVDSDRTGKLYYKLYNLLPVWIMRIFDVFMKVLTKNTYGYSMESFYRYNEK